MKDKGRRPWLSVITGGESLVSHAGGSLLVEVARRSGLARELSTGLGLWRRPFAVHGPGKIVLDMAVAVALGGDAACDVGLLRAQPGVFGPVASDPTVSRLIATLAEDRRCHHKINPGESPRLVESEILRASGGLHVCRPGGRGDGCLLL